MTIEPIQAYGLVASIHSALDVGYPATTAAREYAEEYGIQKDQIYKAIVDHAVLVYQTDEEDSIPDLFPGLQYIVQRPGPGGSWIEHSRHSTYPAARREYQAVQKGAANYRIVQERHYEQ